MMSKFVIKQIQRICGGVITEPFVDETEGTFGFRVIKDGNTYCVWVLRDDNINAPGYLSIEQVD